MVPSQNSYVRTILRATIGNQNYQRVMVVMDTNGIEISSINEKLYQFLRTGSFFAYALVS